MKEFNQNPVIIKKNYKSHNDEISLIKKYSKILVSKKRADAINEAIEKKFNSYSINNASNFSRIKNLVKEKTKELSKLNELIKENKFSLIKSSSILEDSTIHLIPFSCKIFAKIDAVEPLPLVPAR